MQRVYDKNKQQINILTDQDETILIKENGDLFVKHVNGLLEIYFSRTVDFIVFSYDATFTNLFVTRGMEIPNNIEMVKGKYINAVFDTPGLDLAVSSINIDTFIANGKTFDMFVLAPNRTEPISKRMHFHVVGFWK